MSISQEFWAVAAAARAEVARIANARAERDGARIGLAIAGSPAEVITQRYHAFWRMHSE